MGSSGLTESPPVSGVTMPSFTGISIRREGGPILTPSVEPFLPVRGFPSLATRITRYRIRGAATVTVSVTTEDSRSTGVTGGTRERVTDLVERRWFRL
jgi:hypothetical protein